MRVHRKSLDRALRAAKYVAKDGIVQLHREIGVASIRCRFEDSIAFASFEVALGDFGGPGVETIHAPADWLQAAAGALETEMVDLHTDEHGSVHAREVGGPSVVEGVSRAWDDEFGELPKLERVDCRVSGGAHILSDLRDAARVARAETGKDDRDLPVRVVPGSPLLVEASNGIRGITLSTPVDAFVEADGVPPLNLDRETLWTFLRGVSEKGASEVCLQVHIGQSGIRWLEVEVSYGRYSAAHGYFPMSARPGLPKEIRSLLPSSMVPRLTLDREGLLRAFTQAAKLLGGRQGGGIPRVSVLPPDWAPTAPDDTSAVVDGLSSDLLTAYNSTVAVRVFKRGAHLDGEEEEVPEVQPVMARDAVAAMSSETVVLSWKGDLLVVEGTRDGGTRAHYLVMGVGDPAPAKKETEAA